MTLTQVRMPCRSCPFRLDQTADDIPRFRLELAEALVHCQDGNLDSPMMACHQSTEGSEVICAGWLATHGWDSLQVRIAMSHDKIHPEALAPGEDWPAMHSSYDEALEKLRRTCSDVA